MPSLSPSPSATTVCAPFSLSRSLPPARASTADGALLHTGRRRHARVPASQRRALAPQRRQGLLHPRPASSADPRPRDPAQLLHRPPAPPLDLCARVDRHRPRARLAERARHGGHHARPRHGHPRRLHRPLALWARQHGRDLGQQDAQGLPQRRRGRHLRLAHRVRPRSLNSGALSRRRARTDARRTRSQQGEHGSTRRAQPVDRSRHPERRRRLAVPPRRARPSSPRHPCVLPSALAAPLAQAQTEAQNLSQSTSCASRASCTARASTFSSQRSPKFAPCTRTCASSSVRRSLSSSLAVSP